MRLLALAASAMLSACSPMEATPAGGADGASGGSDGSDGSSACDPAADEDGDGLDACEEETLGTDDALPDTDGDGLTDAEEADCVSDPLDPGERCYACGWPHNDPGTLTPTGAQEGDVIDNLTWVDQCGEQVELHDLAGAWRLLFITTEWCGTCVAEAQELPAARDAFVARTGLDFSFVVVLFQNSSGGLPTAETAGRYAERVEIDDQPVMGDLVAGVLGATPYDGSRLPGVCALTPGMEILACDIGEHGYLRLLDEIEAAAR